tara:strand:- start:548 stop:1237 length:690 start_codon:yes stop_codon:yes gene_type:complete
MLSILIPSARETVYKCVEHILQCSKSINTDFEIIICSKQKLNFSSPKVRVIAEDIDNIGSNKPINQCFSESQGEYFLVTCDDLLMNPNAMGIPEFIESEVFSERKYKICSIGYNSFHNHYVPYQPVGETDENMLIPILSFPAGSRNTVETLLDGVVFNELYKHVAGDNWLSWYVNSNGEPPVFMQNTGMDFSFDTRAETSLCVRQEDIDLLGKMILLSQTTNVNYNCKV